MLLLVGLLATGGIYCLRGAWALLGFYGTRAFAEYVRTSLLLLIVGIALLLIAAVFAVAILKPSLLERINPTPSDPDGGNWFTNLFWWH